jgi:hypothetical protein
MRRPLLSLITISSVLVGPALAQEMAEGRPPSHCIALAENTLGFEVIRAAARDAAQTVDYRSAVPPETVRISYIDHSMFLIQSPGGLSVVTDYNGFIGPAEFIPDVVTMNHAHGTHWTAAPDLRIPHVLRGWNPDGYGPASIASISARRWFAMCPPRYGAFSADRRSLSATRSLSLRWRASASAISAISTTRRRRSNTRRSVASTWSWRRWTVA